MPRHPRIHAAGVLYHVMARGNNGQKIFLKRDDYQAFLNALSNARRRYPFHLYAYVLMSNHFHLLLEVSDAPTSRIMQSLLTGYARRFNAIHRHKGHLFQGRYKAIVCDRESYLLELVRYIHLNPVRAGLVKRPGEWRWSGHQEYLGQDQQKLIDPGPVMAELHSRSRYERFIREGIKDLYRAEWHPGDHAPFLGSERFVKKLAREKSPPPASRRVSLGELLKKVAAKAEVEPEALRRKGRAARLVDARDRFICQAIIDQSYRASEVATFLHCDPSNTSRALQKASEVRDVRQV
jgi:putative transposase